MTAQKGSRRFQEDYELKKAQECRSVAQCRHYVPYTVVSRVGDGGRGDGPRQTPGPAEVFEIRRMNIVVALCTFVKFQVWLLCSSGHTSRVLYCIPREGRERKPREARVEQGGGRQKLPILISEGALIGRGRLWLQGHEDHIGMRAAGTPVGVSRRGSRSSSKI